MVGIPQLFHMFYVSFYDHLDELNDVLTRPTQDGIKKEICIVLSSFFLRISSAAKDVT